MSPGTGRHPPGSVDPFALLDRPMRRRLLVELADEDGSATVRTLADAVVRSDGAGATVVPVDASDVDAVVTQLHHTHLPKLAAAGWVDYDRTANVAAFPDDGEAVRSTLLAAAAELDGICAALDRSTDADE